MALKRAWTERTKLESLATDNKAFIIDKTPFSDEEAGATPTELLYLVRILPRSEVFNQGAFQIQMKLPPTYPFDPPEVKFITRIYHPNVDKDGKSNFFFADTLFPHGRY